MNYDGFYREKRILVTDGAGFQTFEALRHDVTLPLFVEVDAIFNFACPASPVHYQFDPVATTKVSVQGAINMLGLAKRLRCRILQASTRVGLKEGFEKTISYFRQNGFG